MKIVKDPSKLSAISKKQRVISKFSPLKQQYSDDKKKKTGGIILGKTVLSK